MTTMEQMVEAGAALLLGRVNAPEQEIYRAMREALRAALPILGEALGDKIGRHDVTATNVREFLSEIMEGK